MLRLNLDIDHFLDTYWQKKPTVIKQAFTDFTDPILPDELAGLAMEEEVESRLVYLDQDKKWQAELGPFKTFEKLEEDGSVLLIQAVDHWHEDAQQLVREFRFLPNWRVDDLMISYSTPKGGVGPHIDNYDVFIIQGSGSRHWRVGDNIEMNEFSAHAALKHCDAFDAIIDVKLETGDILYIPCGFPHEGYAIDESMSYSVGFRAPDQKDLISSFADHCIDNDEKAVRYTDKNIFNRENSGEISNQELHDLHHLLTQKSKKPEQLIDWLGVMLSEAKHDLDISQPDPQQTEQEILEAFTAGEQFTRLGGLRTMYFEQDPDRVFINGEVFLVDGAHEFGKILCNQDEIGAEMIEFINSDKLALTLFTQLVNLGYWYAD